MSASLARSAVTARIWWGSTLLEQTAFSPRHGLPSLAAEVQRGLHRTLRLELVSIAPQAPLGRGRGEWRDFVVASAMVAMLISAVLCAGVTLRDAIEGPWTSEGGGGASGAGGSGDVASKTTVIKPHAVRPLLTRASDGALARSASGSSMANSANSANAEDAANTPNAANVTTATKAASTANETNSTNETNETNSTNATNATNTDGPAVAAREHPDGPPAAPDREKQRAQARELVNTTFGGLRDALAGADADALTGAMAGLRVPTSAGVLDGIGAGAGPGGSGEAEGPIGLSVMGSGARWPAARLGRLGAAQGGSGIDGASGPGADGSGVGGYGSGVGIIGGQKDVDIGLSMMSPTVVGALDKELIRAVVRAHRAQLRFCYELALTRTPQLAGRVAVKFIISPTGSVSTASVLETTVLDPGLEACLAGRVRTWQFPTSRNGGATIVTYPFLFSRAD